MDALPSRRQIQEFGHGMLLNAIFMTPAMTRSFLFLLSAGVVLDGLSRSVAKQFPGSSHQIERDGKAGVSIDTDSRMDSLKVAPKTSVKGTLKTALAIISAIEKDSRITIPEIAKMFSVSTRTAHNHVQRLKNAGIIRRVGPDKGGHWEVSTFDNQ